MNEIKLNNERKHIFKKHFLTPIENFIKLGKIGNPEDNSLSDTYRKIWLQQGRQNFDNPNTHNCPLNSSELVDLYCYYYLQMHYSSSLLIFNNGAETLLDICNAKNSVHFIDIGCGPITSGIAFNHWLQDNIEGSKNILYYGIDTSKSMYKKAEELLKENNFIGEYLQANIYMSKQKELSDNICNYMMNQVSSQIVIVNCSYLFASKSLDVDEFKEEIDNLTILLTAKSYTPTDSQEDFLNLLEELHKPKINIIYQNPKGYRQKWDEFKQKMSTFNSVNNYPQIVPFSYKSATQSDRKFNFDVSVDIIKNY